LALALSDNTRNRDNSAFIYHFINFATYEPMFIPLGAPVFATAAVASMIDPDAAEWVNGAAFNPTANVIKNIGINIK
jgi:hypothetical protein